MKVTRVPEGRGEGNRRALSLYKTGFAARTGESESNPVWKRKGKAIEFRSLSAADFEV